MKELVGLFFGALSMLATSFVPPAQTRASTPYEVLDSTINCLTDAAIARDTLQGIKDTGTAVGDSFQIMTAHRSVIRRFQGCRDSLGRLNSSGEAMTTAVEALRFAFDGLLVGFQRSLKLDEKMLTTTTEAELRAIVPEASEVADIIDSSWRGIAYATVAVTYTLVDPSRLSAQKTVSRLRLTRSEFNRAKKSLLTFFPNAAKDTPNRHAVDGSAYLMWQFFEKPWVAADER